MENKDKKVFDYVDSGNISHSVQINEEDFDLVQVDKSIHDTKFKSKPTTFFKDALKRFAKNKASVVGGVILGILLLSSFIIPIVDRNPITGNQSTEQFLPPKLFPAGTGFWDGTVTYKNKIADPDRKGTDKTNKETYGKILPGNYALSETESVVFEEGYLSNISEPREGFTNAPTPFGRGGSLVITADEVRNLTDLSDEEFLKDRIVKFFSPKFTFELTDDNNFTFKTVVDKDYKAAGYEAARYSLTLEFGSGEKEETAAPKAAVKAAVKEADEEKASKSPSKLNNYQLILSDFTKDSVTVNLKDAIEAALNGTDEDLKTNLQEEIKDGKIDNAYISINVESSLKTNNVAAFKQVETKLNNDLIDEISVSDPCKRLANVANPWTIFSYGNGSKALHEAKCYYIDFSYDAYGAQYGLVTNTISQTEIQSYIDKGQLPKDFITNSKQYDGNKYNFYDNGYDKSPVVTLQRVKRGQGSDGSIKYSYICSVYNYKIKGYNHEPIFIFGTNKEGYDLFKIVFVGLRTSLLLGILASSVCFVFGLCYGAISGYFGGAVDLIMQRFSDILSGIPWIVIMTLIILKFGANFGTFAAALCLTGWIGTANLTRTQFYRFRGREYILASRTLGASDARLIFRHILPNAMGTIITSSVLMIPSVIFSEATISYLGLGLKDMQSIGVILSDNQKYLQDRPHLLIVPAVVIALLMISFNLFGNGLRDAFNPSLKGSE